MLFSVIALVSATTVFCVLLISGIRNSTKWSATVTPLASIIGSGFLVSVPLLTHAVGVWAIVAMVGLMIVAYMVGGVIRYNIRYTAPLLKSAPAGSLITSAERVSLLTLIFAYVISVSYYLTLLSAFLLNAIGINDPATAKSLTTAVLLIISGIGTWRGLRGLEKVELFAVSFNLAVIAGLLLALACFSLFGDAPASATPSQPPTFNWNTIQVILGLLIVVQGFETSKFLDSEYDVETRITTMRRAQWISGVVYLLFFALVTPLMSMLGQTNEVTAIISLVAQVAIVLPIAVTLGAMASQFSASIADSIGAGGLVHDISGKHISIRHTYPLIGIVGVVIIWETNVVELISLASRAFALFYASQCIVATISACQHNDPNKHRNVFYFSVMAMLCLAIVIFGKPVEA